MLPLWLQRHPLTTDCPLYGVTAAEGEAMSDEIVMHQECGAKIVKAVLTTHLLVAGIRETPGGARMAAAPRYKLLP